MNPRCRYILNCLAVGMLSTTILALLGFWARWICVRTLSDLTRGRNQQVRLSPMGLLPDEVENDPNVVAQSEALLTHRQAGLPPQAVGLGALEYFHQLFAYGVGRSDLLYWDSKSNGKRLHFDRRQGLFVYSAVEKQLSVERKNPDQRIWLYAGPEGMADAPDKALGRFRSPIVSVWGASLVVYGPQQQRFYRVDFEEKRVVKGPQLDPDDAHKPIQIGAISKHANLFSWRIESPRREKDPNDPDPSRRGTRHDGGRETYPEPPVVSSIWSSPYAFVLDASGRIDLLDQGTLDFAGRAGALPWVPERFGRFRMPAEPQSLFAYDVRPILTPEDDALSKWQYRGCLAGAYNHDGSHMALVAFDSQGARVGAAGLQILTHADVPGGPMVATTRFLLENLHPPALLLLSYFTAPHCPAGSGYRSIFVLPDSIVAMQGRNLRQFYIPRFINALVMMLLAIALAFTLAVLVARDAQVVGFSKDTRTLWVLITIAFGLPAYITYRLTRPKATLVTCANCGLPRRPDLDVCHRCRSPWEVPELNPPSWRVLDAGRRDIDKPPPKAEETATD